MKRWKTLFLVCLAPVGVMLALAGCGGCSGRSAPGADDPAPPVPCEGAACPVELPAPAPLPPPRGPAGESLAGAVVRLPVGVDPSRYARLLVDVETEAVVFEADGRRRRVPVRLLAGAWVIPGPALEPIAPGKATP